MCSCCVHVYVGVAGVAQAISRMIRSLDEMVIAGVPTTAGYHKLIMQVRPAPHALSAAWTVATASGAWPSVQQVL